MGQIGLDTSGNKQDLINRLVNNSKNQSTHSLEVESHDVKGMEILYLKELVQQLNRKIRLQDMVIQLLNEKTQCNQITVNEENRKRIVRSASEENDIGVNMVETLHNKINPCEMAIGIANIKNTKAGVVIVTRVGDEDRKKFKKAVEKKFGKEVKTEEVKKFRPRIKVNGVKEVEHLDGDEIRRIIIQKNPKKNRLN